MPDNVHPLHEMELNAGARELPNTPDEKAMQSNDLAVKGYAPEAMLSAFGV